ncbi:MAG: ATP-dependent DNA helicase UvrD2 [Acidimicrobiales bacterium]
MSRFPGPVALGRGVVVGPGASVPAGAEDWPWVAVGEDVVNRPSDVVSELHRRWLDRKPVIVELVVQPVALRVAERCELPPWEVAPDHEFWLERLQYLVWSNNYDWRDQAAEPIWWHARRAVRLGASPSDEFDVVLPSGAGAWCDGGPRGPVVGLAAAIVHREAIEAGSLRPDGDRQATSDLAADQRRAVEHGAGPARIIAPAGSGKTRVLTERLRHLLTDRQLTPGSVLAVAFNKRAADELVERTPGLPVHIRTLNSLGLAIVNGTGPFAATTRARSVIDEREVRRILESVITVRRQVNTDPWVPYLDALSAIRLGLAPPPVAEEMIPDAVGIADAFDKYRAVLADRDVLDFDEQIYRAIELLLSSPDVRKKAQGAARHLLVDEFQDLTPAHLLMLRLLAAPTFDVFGVGDDDQVIYSYAGASPEFLINYDNFFPGAAAYALETNYRCPPSVVRGATELLARNHRRVAKTIQPRAGRPDEPGSLTVSSRAADEQAGYVAEEIGRLSAEGVAMCDVAVLTRVNVSLLPLQVTLAERGIPSTRPIGREVLERTGIRTALAYLRIGASPREISRADIAETIRRPSRKIARNVSEMLRRDPTTSVAGIRRLAGALSGKDVDRLEDYADDLETVAEAVRSGSTAQALRVIGSQVGLGGAMDALDSGRREVDRSSHLDDLAALRQVAVLHPDPSTFGSWLRERLAVGEGDASTGVVTLSTVHRVKGQEWPHVFVLGASDGLFPHRLASDVEEERRIFHVAITRASLRAVVVADQDQPSPFCDEMLGRDPRVEHVSRTDRTSSISPARPGAQPGTAGPGEEGREKLSRALRDWRKDTCTRDKVPAYVVLSDADLEGIVTRRPTTLRELARCRGIGPLRLEKYGDDILAVMESAG